MKSIPTSFARGLRITALVAVGAATFGPAHAGVMDFLFGSKKSEAQQPAQRDTGRRTWRLGEFTEIRLVPSEAGAAANNHPAVVSDAVLRDLLGQVRLPSGRAGVGELLFTRTELDGLLDPLVEAFNLAGPRDDVLLVSTSRRDGGLLLVPTAVTARLFVTGGNLNLIVHDSRFDFFGDYRGGKKQPEFVYGSRRAAGGAAIERTGATVRRADWLELPLGAAPAGALPAAGGAAAATTGAAMPAPATAAPPRARDAAFFEEQEQRLTALKRLRDRGLITEEEYQQKRSEVLKAL
jgi:hypothetical protein